MTKPFSILILSLLCIAFTSTDCKHTPTGPNNPSFALTVEDASCTEAWLKLSIANITNPIVVIKRDTLIIDTLLLTTTDTTIVDENLLPSTPILTLLNYSTTQQPKCKHGRWIRRVTRFLLPQPCLAMAAVAAHCTMLQ
jgi:hypothetical protein